MFCLLFYISLNIYLFPIFISYMNSTFIQSSLLIIIKFTRDCMIIIIIENYYCEKTLLTKSVAIRIVRKKCLPKTLYYGYYHWEYYLSSILRKFPKFKIIITCSTKNNLQSKTYIYVSLLKIYLLLQLSVKIDLLEM